MYDAASDTEVHVIVTCPFPGDADTPVGADGAEPVVVVGSILPPTPESPHERNRKGMGRRKINRHVFFITYKFGILS